MSLIRTVVDRQRTNLIHFYSPFCWSGMLIQLWISFWAAGLKIILYKTFWREKTRTLQPPAPQKGHTEKKTGQEEQVHFALCNVNCAVRALRKLNASFCLFWRGPCIAVNEEASSFAQSRSTAWAYCRAYRPLWVCMFCFSFESRVWSLWDARRVYRGIFCAIRPPPHEAPLLAEATA